MYLTYDEYKSMGGTAEEPAFTRLCTAACGRIDRLTHGRIHGLDEVPEAVRLSAFELIRRAEKPSDYFATFDCFEIGKKLIGCEKTVNVL